MFASEGAELTFGTLDSRFGASARQSANDLAWQFWDLGNL
jgi:hypothetical protein